MFYRPEYVLFAGFAVYAAIWIVAPLTPTVDFSAGSLAFIILNSLAFLAGSRFADRFPAAPSRHEMARVRIARIEAAMFWAMSAMGGFGIILRAYDKYVLRAAGDLSGLAAREVLLDNSASLFSAIAGTLYPFCFIPLFIILASRSLRKSKAKLAISTALFLLPAIDALVQYSRSLFLVSLAMMYFGASITLFRGNPLPRKLVFPLVLGGIGALLLSANVFQWRLEEMNLAVDFSVFNSAYAYTVQPNNLAWGSLMGQGLGSTILSATLPIMQYYVHGLFEFQILWDAPEQRFSYGALLLAPYVKLLSIIGLAENPDLYDLFPRVGVFTSFFGPLWVDFGWFAFAAMFLFGVAARLLARQVMRNDIGAYPLYSFLCVVLFFAPVVNLLVSAQGFYLINAMALFWLATRAISRLEPTDE